MYVAGRWVVHCATWVVPCATWVVSSATWVDRCGSLLFIGPSCYVNNMLIGSRINMATNNLVPMYLMRWQLCHKNSSRNIVGVMVVGPTFGDIDRELSISCLLWVHIPFWQSALQTHKQFGGLSAFALILDKPY